MKLEGASEPEIEIRSRDLRWTFDQDVPCFDLDSGELKMARFQFRLHPRNRKPTTVTFEVEPPDRTDLAQKQYAEVIENYLVQQKVKLL